MRYYFLLSLTILLAVGCDSITPEQDPEPINELVFGKWVFKKGDTIGFLTDAGYSQTIAFSSSGNYTESALVGSTSEPSEVSASGNWKGGDAKMVLNDWNGSKLSDTLYIKSVTADELLLTYRGSEYLYIKAENEVPTFSSWVVGKWHNTDNTDTFTFSKDGTGQHRKQQWDNIYSNASLTWWMEASTLVIHYDEAASGYNQSFEISFANNHYLGIDGRGLSEKVLSK